jgi:hypothetical protein
LKAQYAELNDSDMKLEEAKEDELITRVQTRLNKERGEVVELIRTGQIERK